MKIQHSDDYRERRKREYPPIGDQLDAIVKLVDVLRERGVEIPIETQHWVNHCLAVKDKYRKN